MKKLSIIVPRYKENLQSIVPLFSSLKIQTNFDINGLEVIICDDNPDDPLSDTECFDIGRIFGFDISIVHLPENRGPGVARQYGIDNASGEWLMFCDADDTLFSANVMSVFFGEIKKYPETDYMSSHWIEEEKDPKTKEFLYVQHDLENTWMHGKIIKRSLLIENNIRFHDELRVHEDTYFLSLVADAAKSRRLLTIPTYIWRWSDNTITRRNDGVYIYKEFPTFIKAVTLANTELRNRGSKMIAYHVDQLVLYCFFVLQQDMWVKPEVEEYRKQSIQMLKNCMVDFWDIYDSSDEQSIRQIYMEERAKHFKQNEIEHYSLFEWIQMLKK